MNEQRSHFALWSLFKSPLFIGADLRSLNREAKQILTAGEVIAVNQDPLGVAGDLVWKQGPLEVSTSSHRGSSLFASFVCQATPASCCLVVVTLPFSMHLD